MEHTITVRIERVTKKIRKNVILDNISMEMHGGRIYGLKGKNGAGKTMLMRSICGLIIPNEGFVRINDDIIGKNISFPPSIGALLENPSFIDNYTGFKNLKMLADIKKKIGEDQIKETLKRVGLEPEDKRTYRKYSLGMKQRLGIAAAIMEEPDIIILDEPINALDENGASLVRDILHDLRNNGCLIIIACHDTDELRFLSDEIYTLSDGKLASHEIINTDT